MLDDMRVNDEPLIASDIQQLQNADEIARFFTKLRYDVKIRHSIPLGTTGYANTDDLKKEIRHHEVIATDADKDICIYLFEVRSVTAKLRNRLADGFRLTSDEKVLFILTADYEEIEFVYLKRTLEKTKRKDRKPTIRPIPLTVNRQNPDSVALRVLKRFTFTEADSDYQWTKIKLAYRLAEWSEEYFNNRALFSNYYLNNRLTDDKITPSWGEDVRPIRNEVFNRLTTPQIRTYQTKDTIRRQLYEPLFKLLGFTYKEEPSNDSPTQQADYLLYAPNDTQQPIAAALTYIWNRNLDDVDVSREQEEQGDTPFEIPGARVVSLLEAQVAPWVIVTNGKLWRLYSSTASNKATNYYEIDLEEALVADDRIRALKYWWLMFRREAFSGFLDDLLKKSTAYAKELGDRLKDRVFVEIFPQFAKGFIADMRVQGVQEADINLDTVFSGTMIFLYRLMFMLYAESLELMPMNEKGYSSHSLATMKEEISKVGGTALQTSANNLRSHYQNGSTRLYERLTMLFRVIDEGSDELNMPTYNGGLFSSKTDSGQFLNRYNIPDDYLAQGLDRLTRDVDEKTQALVFIDFKSLGVRQLGSIYEGLLEFKLKIATEALAVAKEKGKEVYQPTSKVKKPLATLEKGEVYLENDKRERKATGSYYTPDYIVKYIVRHTVGPILDRKFAELTPRLRTAQKDYRNHDKLVTARNQSSGNQETPDAYWNTPNMRQLVDDLLNVRVLDPAMGSGHFLVEVVDYISNRLIDFLNGWTQNPIWAFIDRTRQDIVDDMERQRVTIDTTHLTRVVLLKRAVLKRCIYGVDLNAMAVELAKVSLWLDAFTRGAPLSFLDHHLKHGNSLIGAMDLSDMVAVGSKRWEIILEAAAEMVEVSRRTDATIGQVDTSKSDYLTARAKLEDVKKYANVSVASYFVDELMQYSKKKPSKDMKQMLTQVAQIAYGTQANADRQSLFDRAQATAVEKRFFHWWLEFPEVFIDLDKRDWAKNGGFDAVVGNPPYGNISSRDEIAIIRDLFAIAEYTIDSFALFIEQATNKLRSTSQIGYIIPNSWQTSKSFIGFRKLIIDRCRLQQIVNLPYDVFKDAYIDTMIIVVEKRKAENNKTIVKVMNFDKREKPTEIRETDSRFSEVDYGRWFGAIDPNHEYQFLSFLSASELDVFIKLIENSITLGDITDIQRGISPFHPESGKETKQYKQALDGELLRYHYDFSGESVVLYDPSIAEYKPLKYFIGARIILRQLISRQFRLQSVLVTEDFITNQSHQTILLDDENYSLYYLQGLLNSNLLSHYYVRSSATALKDDFPRIVLAETKGLPIPRIHFTTPADERERLTKQITGAYSTGNHREVLQQVHAVLGANQSDVVHDVLAHLAQRMIDLNKHKHAEVQRFITWLEATLQIIPKDGKGGVDSLTGKTILQGYLGDYQKGEGETTWDDFSYRLHQNRNRFSASLSQVEGTIQTEYEQSLSTLLPIKRDLARTDTLIDKIVYHLYGLTDAEVEIIERPQYEQALADAKAQVIGDEKIKDDDEKIAKIAENVLSASNRFFDRVDTPTDEEILDRDLPKWRQLPPEAPKFLLTGDYVLRTFPDHMDFSSSVIPHTKAVEVMLDRLVFQPFRASNHTDQDCHNPYLQGFMRGEKELTLGSYMIILSSGKETALRNFMARSLRNVERMTTTFNDEAIRDIRNKAAHDEVVSRDEAHQIRVWCVHILGMV